MDRSQITIAAIAGIAFGLVLLARGLRAYLGGQRVAGIGSSPIASIAAGEVRVTGVVEADALTLVSPLQSASCVWYRARVTQSQGRSSETILADERAIGFRVRDASGSIRVFPRGARWEAAARLDEGTSLTGEPPPGLRLRAGPGIASGVPDPAAETAALLTVHPAATDLSELGGSQDGWFGGLPGRGAGASGSASLLGGAIGSQRHYEERRLEVGDAVTVIGSALPFAEVADPEGADALDGGLGADDPEVLRDLAAAREAGLLAASSEEAWGNAAIPGFGIGRPVRRPDLDPGAAPVELADAAMAARAAVTFEIAPQELVLAAAGDTALTIYEGTPAEAIGRSTDRLLVGVLGATFAIASALVLALAVSGRLGA